MIWITTDDIILIHSRIIKGSGETVRFPQKPTKALEK